MEAAVSALEQQLQELDRRVAVRDQEERQLQVSVASGSPCWQVWSAQDQHGAPNP